MLASKLSILTSGSPAAGTGTHVQSPSSKQLRMLARKLSQAEPGLKLSGSTLKQASDLISQATAKIEAQMSSGALDGSVLSGLSQVRSAMTYFCPILAAYEAACYIDRGPDVQPRPRRQRPQRPVAGALTAINLIVLI